MAPRTVKKIKSRDEFNKHRILHLSNLPPSAEGEIREFLGKFKAKKIQIADTLNTADVTLNNGALIDDAVSALTDKEFKDSTVSAAIGHNCQLICVAHLPPNYDDNMFKALCEKHGNVEYAYIMREESSGDSKGYGLVEFATDLEQAKQIKGELDWKTVDGQNLHAEFVDEACQASFDAMQSQCLLITGMPDNFTDVTKLRETYSCVTSPVYCQIIAKGEKSLGYGILEYRTYEEAEQTCKQLKKEKIEGNDIVLTFCVPGKSAVVINNRIMWKFGDKLTKNSSLLQDPVEAKPVIAGNPIVIGLNKQNPKLMDHFTKVLGGLQQAYVSQMMSPVHKPGLLGPAPSLPLSPMMNPNTQLGLFLLIAIQVHSAKKEQFTGVLSKQLNTLSEQEKESSTPKGSILGDPMTGQANVVLTSLKQQLVGTEEGEEAKKEIEGDTPQAKVDAVIDRFNNNGKNLNLNLLTTLGQLFVTMKHQSSDSMLKSQAQVGPKGGLLGPIPAGPLGGPVQSLLGPAIGATPPNKGSSLLGDPPKATPPASGSGSGMLPTPGGMGNMGGMSNMGGMNNNSIMQAMGLNLGSSASSAGMGNSLLNQISQGLVHQIGQNLLYQIQVQGKQGAGGPGGKGLLGDIPNDGNQNQRAGGSQRGAAAQSKSSLLGEPPARGKGASQNASTNQDQNWKGSDSAGRWGSGSNFENGFNKGNTAGQGGYGDYSYGQDSSYAQGSDMMAGYGNYGDNSGNNDYYNFQQQTSYYAQVDMTQQGTYVYSEYGVGGNMSSGSGGMGGNSYGMGSSGSGGAGGAGGTGGTGGAGGAGGSSSSMGNYGGSSGVNFQDSQGYGKGMGGGQDSTGYGSDSYGVGGNSYGVGGNSYGVGGNSYGVGGNSYGVGGNSMGSGQGYGSYGSGRGGNDDMGSMGNYDSYGSVGMSGNYGSSSGSGMAGGMSSNSGMGSAGMGGMDGSMGGMGGSGSSMSGMGNMGSGMGGMGSGMSSSMGSGMGGGGSGSGSGMGSGMNSMASGMGNSGMGMGGMTSSGMSSMSSSSMGMGSSGMGMGGSGMGMGGMGNSGMGMSGMNSSGMGMSGGSSGSMGMGGSSSGMGMGSSSSGMGMGSSSSGMGMGGSSSGMGMGSSSSGMGMGGSSSGMGMGGGSSGMGAGSGMGMSAGSGMGMSAGSGMGMSAGSGMGMSAGSGMGMSGGGGMGMSGGMGSSNTGMGMSGGSGLLGSGMGSGMGGMNSAMGMDGGNMSYSTMGSGSGGAMGSSTRGGGSSLMGSGSSGSQKMGLLGAGMGGLGSSMMGSASGMSSSKMDSSMMMGQYQSSGGPGGLLPPPGKSMLTPAGQKRSIGSSQQQQQLLPEPEPSPDGDYIGQHSQGLGGHYSESYKRRRLF